MRFQTQLKRQDFTAGGDRRQFAERRRFRAEAIDPSPRWQSEPGHEALTFDSAISEEHEASGREEIRFALEARGEQRGGEAQLLQKLAIYCAFARAGRQQVGQIK